MRRLPLLLVLLAAVTAATAAEVPMDVPKDHWAYDAVRELANRGFVLGYPDGNFLGDRTLTRYEFATVIKRIVDNIDAELLRLKSKSDASVTAEDIETVSKLVDGFKVELLIIGTRLEKVEGALEATRADVSKLKKVKVSGLVQTRYQDIDYVNEDVARKDYDPTFLIRRARVKVTAAPTDRSAAVLQFDMGQNAMSVKDAYFQYAFGANAAKAPSMVVGQMKWPFGYELPCISFSWAEIPDRALFIRRFFPGERDQGLKIMAPGDTLFCWQLGVFNGTGIQKSNYRDLNSAKDVIANVRWCGARANFAVSGYFGEGAWQTFGVPATYLKTVDRVRYGADLQAYLDRLTFRAEYVRGKGVDAADAVWDQKRYVDGCYAQLNYDATAKDTLVARYSTMSEDPVEPQYGRRSAWEFGYLRWLDRNSRLKLFYKVNQEQYNEFYNDGLAAEWLVTY